MSSATSRGSEAASGKDPSSLLGLSYGLLQHGWCGCADVPLHCMQSFCQASQLHGVRSTVTEGPDAWLRVGLYLLKCLGLERVWLLAEQPYTELHCVKKASWFSTWSIFLSLQRAKERKQKQITGPASCLGSSKKIPKLLLKYSTCKKKKIKFFRCCSWSSEDFKVDRSSVYVFRVFTSLYFKTRPVTKDWTAFLVHGNKQSFVFSVL